MIEKNTYNILQKLKVFTDRTCRWFHKPELTSIPIIFVATTAASGLKNTLNYMENIAVQWGAFPADRIMRTAKSMKKDIVYNEFKQFQKLLYMPKEKYKPNFNQLIYFQVQKVLAEKILTIDEAYWREKEWLGKSYFFDANINPVKKIFATMFYKILYSRIRKVDYEKS